MPDPKSAVILGARSIVGAYLAQRLAAAGYGGLCSGRASPHPGDSLPPGFAWQRLDPAAPGDWHRPADAIVFSLFPLPHLAPLLPHLSEAKQIIAVSTSGLLYKKDSDDPEERAYMARLEATEAALRDLCAGHGIGWTLLRPTLIYRPGRDKNVTAIARFIERFGCFPVASPARGLRQPVHADDVAQAAAAAADNPAAQGQTFFLPGAETLTYREMVARIFVALGRRPVILALPAGLLGLALRLGRAITGSAYSPALFARMNADLTFDPSAAIEVLDYAPRAFQPDFGESG